LFFSKALYKHCQQDLLKKGSIALLN